MSAKKKGSVVILILSIISLVIGVVWTMTTFVVALTYSSVPLVRIVVLLAISILFIILGVLGIMLRPREKKDGKKKSKAGIIIAVVVCLVFLLGSIPLISSLSFIGHRGVLNSALDKYVKDDWTEEGVAMPDNPYFVFYCENDGNFAVPASSYTKGTDDPKKVNVVVMYKDETFRDGTWVGSVSGEEVGAAMTQRTHVYILRLNDWALIDDHVFDFALGYGEKSVNSTGRDEIKTYINNIVK
ncbi:MAG: hypothetical protein K5659_08010 [Lachnospiraceae bacterium]|nr:hypothetical protein [Lachnospiraceae bacterium]